MLHNRLTGFVFFALGLFLIFVIIPGQTETVDYGLMRPQSLPIYTGWVVVICALVLMVRGSDDPSPNFRHIGKAILFWSVLVFGMVLIARFGFLIVSPYLALVLMVMIGERRVKWLIVGGVGMPLFIWLTVVVILGRQLP